MRAMLLASCKQFTGNTICGDNPETEESSTRGDIKVAKYMAKASHSIPKTNVKEKPTTLDSKANLRLNAAGLVVHENPETVTTSNLSFVKP